VNRISTQFAFISIGYRDTYVDLLKMMQICLLKIILQLPVCIVQLECNETFDSDTRVPFKKVM